MALVKTVANSAPIVPMAKATSARVTAPSAPGAANHSVNEPATSITEKPAIHGFRGPPASATAPSIGEKTAMTKPAAAVA